MDVVIAWILSFIVSVAPPGRTIHYPDAQETKEEAVARYESIAKDVAEVAYSPDIKPIFGGPSGRSQTVAVILSVMSHESSFMKHVDYGLGKHSRGDLGNSWCLMQLNIGKGKTLRWNTKLDRMARPGDLEEDIFEGYTGLELVQNRKACIQEGLKILRVSVSACKSHRSSDGSRLPMNQWLRAYASGNCEAGGQASANRMNTAIKWFYRTSASKGFEDEEVLQLMQDSSENEPNLDSVAYEVAFSG